MATGSASAEQGKKVALIAGASGLVGRAIAKRLLATGDWKVIGLARRPPLASTNSPMEWIALDLANADDCKRGLAHLKDVTHIFYAVRFDHPEGQPEDIETNAAMLRHLVKALEPVAALRHVHAVHGSKYYGHQLTPVALPMRETSPRAPGENFYFNQEDFLITHSSGKSWTFTTSRPHAFCDTAVDHPRSIGLVFAIYACIQRALGRPFSFPGTEAAYNARTQFTDLALLARAIHWMAEEPKCANQAFNVVNGDTPRWGELWVKFAEYFDVEVGPPEPMKLTDYMQDKGTVWRRIIAEHGLRPTELQNIALWAYGDYQIRPQWDVGSSMDKARSMGFHDRVDSTAMFISQFDHYRAARIVP